MNKVYEIITDTFLKKLEEGTVPWKKKWDAPGAVSSNLISKRPYSGINLLILAWSGFTSPYWATFNQLSQIGAKIQKGQKGTKIVFYKFPKPEDDFEYPIMRYYNIWNADQVEGIPEKYLPTPDEAAEIDKITGDIDERCRKVLLGYENKPKISTGGNRACYSPDLDKITVPKRRYFESLDEYWSTLFHELAHSTGHEDRLDRKLGNTFGSTEYSFEELVAEMTAAFLCAESKISNEDLTDNSAAYIASWLQKLKSEPSWVIKASRLASRAANYILKVPEEAEKAA